MRVVGLTGGIASGKSTVARMFQKAGAVIIDADRIARQVVAPGLPAWHEIRQAFGPTVLLPDGTIDREALGRLVFADPDKRRQLERIVHPRVGEEMATHMADAEQTDPDAVVLLDIPLLFETNRTQGLSDIIVVWLPEALQRRRLMERDGLSETDARARMNAQLPLAEKRRRATIVIDNSGAMADTAKQVHAIYRRLAGQHGGKAE